MNRDHRTDGGSAVDERQQKDAGFSLLEAVVAMVIFGIVAASTAAVLVRGVGASSDNRARAAAASVAAQTLDQLRLAAKKNDGYLGLKTQPLDPVTVQGRVYSVFSSVTVATGTNTGSPCTSGGLSNEVYRKIAVTVSWANSGSVQPVRTDTIVQNPGVASDPAKGALGVIVSGPNGPRARVLVSLNNGSTALTDEAGCAYFSGLAAPATYVATASATGYVNENGGATAAQQAGVQRATATVVNLAYAPASQPDISFKTTLADGSSDPAYLWPGTAGNPLAYTLRNDAKDRSGATTTSLVSPAPMLYPYNSGYNVWLGGCATEAPLSVTNFATFEGTTPTVTVPVGGISVQNTTNRTLNVALKHTDACTTLIPLQIVPGGVAKIALPYGSWTAVAYSGLVTGVLTGSGITATATPSPVVLTTAAPIAAVRF
jgi:prepilin-type N-terminal cleavage/methylation domain-containing protein